MIRRLLLCAALTAAFQTALYAEAPGYPLKSVTLFGFRAYLSEFRETTAKLSDQPYDKAQLQAAVDGIVRRYRENGYRFARAAPVKTRLLRGRSPGYHATVRMDEGVLDEIEVRGAAHTREEVIRSQLLLKPGKVYFEADRQESERILRDKPYIGAASIKAEADPQTNRVKAIVTIEELWGLVPRFRLVDTGSGTTLKGFLRGEIGFLMNLTDSNFLGSGQRWRFQYRWDAKRFNNETGRVEGGRSRTGIEMSDPNLFGSRWEFSAQYLQQPLTDIDAWEASLSLPFYSLRANWAASLSAYDFGRLSDYRENGVLLRQRERHLKGQAASLTRAFGKPNRRLLTTVWLRRGIEDSRLTLPEVRQDERQEPRATHALIGGRLSARSIRFRQYRNLDRMGNVEDIALGHSLNVGAGVGLTALSNDLNELRPSLSYRISAPIGRETLWQGALLAEGSYLFESARLEDASALVYTRLFLRRGSSRMAVLRAQYESRFRPRRETNLLLGGEFGIRGYGSRALDGQRKIILNIEARQTVWEHRFFAAMGALFYDHGFIWRDSPSWNDPARSVGFGLRIGVRRIARAPVLRVDAAYGFDPPSPGWRLHFGTGHHF